MLKFDVEKMTPQERNLRQNVRNFLLPATLDEMWGEVNISWSKNELTRMLFVLEMIHEVEDEITNIRNAAYESGNYIDPEW